MKENLALALGHLFGDGGISSKGRVHYCNTEDFLVKEFVDSMSFFEIEPWIHNEENILRVNYPVMLGRELWRLFGRFSFGKDTKIITSEIDKIPLSWKVKMLRAWFNDDGTVVNYNSKYRVVAIKQKLRPLVVFIHDTLKELGINSQISEDQGKWILRITKFKDIVKFRDKVNFSENYRKAEKLDELIKGIKNPHDLTKDKILFLLRKSSKTRKELSKELDLTLETIYEHLHGRKTSSRKVEGLISQGLVGFNKKEGVNIYSLI